MNVNVRTVMYAIIKCKISNFPSNIRTKIDYYVFILNLNFLHSLASLV